MLLDDFAPVYLHPSRIGPVAVERAELIKGQPNGPRRVYRAEWSGHRVLIKLDRRTGRHSFGSVLGHELRMHQLVAESGAVRVPEALALARRRRGLWTRDEALVLRWIDDYDLLRQRVHEAVRTADGQAFDGAAELYAGTIATVRRAGFCDADMGVGNLMVSRDGVQVVWIDLEHARTAEPADARGTVTTLSAALVSWWVASGGDRPRFLSLAERVCQLTPEPRGGWPEAMRQVQRTIDRAMIKQIRYGRASAPPPTVDRVPA